MKLQFKRLDEDSSKSIYVKRVNQPYVGKNWHFHPEFELIYFIKGQGIRIVGDHISNFRKGELVLVGEGVPHLWQNDSAHPEDPDFIVIKFLRDFNGSNLFSLPELSDIRVLLNESHRGILFSNTTLPKIHNAILELSESNSLEMLITFLGLLQILSTEEHYELLSSPDFSLPAQVGGENRLHKVIDYISENYNGPISLEEISEIAIMTPPAFCRFFKTRTNKTFSLFLNQVRISKACQLLIDDEMPVKEICFATGFGSLTNFNRTFRSFKGNTPKGYRTKYRSFQG